MTYKQKFQCLLDHCANKGISVDLLSEELHDYAGMNSEIGRILGFPIPENAIAIDKNLNNKKLFQTLKHEIWEMDLMKQGMSYWDAHRIALEKEKEGDIL